MSFVGDRTIRDSIRFSAQDFRARAQEKLTLDVPSLFHDLDIMRTRGDHRFGDVAYLRDRSIVVRPAAVLIGIVARDDGASVLLTQRASTLRRHSGQIAFPGGAIDPSDATPADAALREAEEEIGLSRGRVTPLGYLDAYLVGTGFCVMPLVAMVTPPFDLICNPSEVEAAFEVPLAFLMEPSNHELASRELNGLTRQFYVMPFGDRRIWGATANILRLLYERLYA